MSLWVEVKYAASRLNMTVSFEDNTFTLLVTHTFTQIYLLLCCFWVHMNVFFLSFFSFSLFLFLSLCFCVSSTWQCCVVLCVMKRWPFVSRAVIGQISRAFPRSTKHNSLDSLSVMVHVHTHTHAHTHTQWNRAVISARIVLRNVLWGDPKVQSWFKNCVFSCESVAALDFCGWMVWCIMCVCVCVCVCVCMWVGVFWK